MSGFFWGPVLAVLGLFAWLPAAVCAAFGSYPWWLVTPDDPRSPFGQYEPTVRGVYERFGRWVGDVYWLGFRNTFYGLAYALKPEAFKDASHYRYARRFVQNRGWLQVTTVSLAHFDDWGDYDVGHWYELVLRLGPVAVIWGHRLSPVVSNNEQLRHPNMDARPIFSIRLARNA